VESSRRVAPIAFGVVAAVLAVWAVVALTDQRDPAETVEEFLTAVADKDVEGALALVTRYGYGVPYGEEATFLAPEAISDGWWVVSAEEIDREYSSTARVKAVIAGPGGSASGVFSVQEDHDEWLVEDPFARVRFPASPLEYVQVNDKIAPRGEGFASYALFPGTYRFFQSVPGVVEAGKIDAVVVFPAEESRQDREIVPSALTASKNAVAKAEKALRQRIDECTDFATEAPYGSCPFATDGEVDTTDGKRVDELHGLKWTVKTYPEVALTDDRTSEFRPGFALKATTPGAVTLTGAGEDTEGKQTTFTITCDMDLTGITATLTATGDTELATTSPAPPAQFDTCRREA
jgi:hypothetical protein